MAEDIESGWYYYRIRVPHPGNKTIDEMNRRVFQSLYVEAINEKNEAEHVDDCNDSVSLDTQPDENMNWLFIVFDLSTYEFYFYDVCFMKT